MSEIWRQFFFWPTKNISNAKYFSDKEYEVSVVRSGAQTKVKLLENGTDVSDHKVLDTYKKIQQIVGLDFEVFSQLTYQSSTDLLEFLKATDTNAELMYPLPLYALVSIYVLF